MNSTNLSKIKREKMISFLEHLKEKNHDDESIRALNEIENQLNSTKYGLVWEEHLEKVDLKIQNEIPVFKELKEYKINKSNKNSYNFLIEGDNLHSLYLLEKTHKNRIDVIYIDPPYNTGNGDFKYNDKIISKEDSYRHSKWLSFMYKRLASAKRLLSKTGVMFISIDEHEIGQLILLCQQLFNDDNVEYIIWQKTDSKVDRNTNAKTINRFKNVHEAIIVCYNDKNNTVFNKMLKLPDWKNAQKNPDNDPRGPWSSGIISYEEGHKNEDKNSEYYYTITTPTGKKYARHWFVNKEEFRRLAKDNRISYPKGGDGVPRLKTFENEEKEYYMETILKGVGTSSTAKDELLKIFNNREIFDTPKPTKMIKELIRVASNKDSIILDFFAGSGTTGQAVMELNAEDNGNRKFILCTDNFVKEQEELNYFIEKGYLSKMPRKNTNSYFEWKQYYDDFKKTKTYLKIITKEEFQNLGICKGVCYQRLKTITTGQKIDGSKYSKVLDANIKYYTTEWIDRNPEDYFLYPSLCKRVKEMIELENMLELDNKEYILILNKDDLKQHLINNKDKNNIKKIWLNESIIFTYEELEVINQFNYLYIPRRYFSNELREVGE